MPPRDVMDQTVQKQLVRRALVVGGRNGRVVRGRAIDARERSQQLQTGFAGKDGMGWVFHDDHEAGMERSNFTQATGMGGEEGIEVAAHHGPSGAGPRGGHNFRAGVQLIRLSDQMRSGPDAARDPLKFTFTFLYPAISGARCTAWILARTRSCPCLYRSCRPSCRPQRSGRIQRRRRSARVEVASEG